MYVGSNVDSFASFRDDSLSLTLVTSDMT